jgi:hypothetical protein
MLEALATFARATYQPLTRGQVSTLAQIAPNSGTFRNYIGDLKRGGFIELRGQFLEITEAGLQVCDASGPPPTSEELLELWKSKFNAGARRMLEVLVEQYPKALFREELGAAVGIVAASGTFRNYLGDLRRAGLIETRGQEVVASDDLFVSGR